MRSGERRAACALVLVAVVLVWLVMRAGQDEPPVWPDEALFFEPAAGLAAGGEARAPCLAGTGLGLERRALWQPPGHLWALAAVFRVAAPGLAAMRGLSLVAGLLTLVLMHRAGHARSVPLPALAAAGLALALDPLFVRASNLGRMETLELAALAGVLASGTPLARGAWAGLALLVHPAGAVGVAAAAAAALGEPARRRALVATLVPVAGAVLIWAAWAGADAGLARVQLAAQLARKHALPAPGLVASFEWPDGRLMVAALAVAAVGLADWPAAAVLAAGFTLGRLLSPERWYAVLLMPVFYMGLARTRPGRLALGLLIGLYALVWLVGAPRGSHAAWAERVVEATRGAGRILLGSVPDPYFDLRRARPEVVLLEVLPRGLSDGQDAAALEAVDAFVLGEDLERGFSGAERVFAFARSRRRLVARLDAPRGGVTLVFAR